MQVRLVIISYTRSIPHLLENATTGMTAIRQHDFKAAFIFKQFIPRMIFLKCITRLQEQILTTHTRNHITATSKTEGAPSTDEKEKDFSVCCAVITPGQTRGRPVTLTTYHTSYSR